MQIRGCNGMMSHVLKHSDVWTSEAVRCWVHERKHRVHEVLALCQRGVDSWSTWITPPSTEPQGGNKIGPEGGKALAEILRVNAAH